MKKLLPLIMLATPLMAGCVSANSAEGAKAEAYAKCRYAPGPEEREKCMKTELALIQARERNEAQRIQTNREDAEQRQAILAEETEHWAQLNKIGISIVSAADDDVAQANQAMLKVQDQMIEKLGISEAVVRLAKEAVK